MTLNHLYISAPVYIYLYVHIYVGVYFWCESLNHLYISTLSQLWMTPMIGRECWWCSVLGESAHLHSLPIPAVLRRICTKKTTKMCHDTKTSKLNHQHSLPIPAVLRRICPKNTTQICHRTRYPHWCMYVRSICVAILEVMSDMCRGSRYYDCLMYVILKWLMHMRHHTVTMTRSYVYCDCLIYMSYSSDWSTCVTINIAMTRSYVSY